MNVVLVREVTEPAGSGPWNGMFALQQALRERMPDWFRIGSQSRSNELCWYWNWQDIDLALERIARGQPFVIGPNVSFALSGDPGGGYGERAMLDAPICRATMCHSAVYGELSRANLVWRSRALIGRYPYTILPLPDSPDRAHHDLLIFEKTGGKYISLESALRAIYPRSVTLRYGTFQREDLYEVARRSRACVYLCD